MSDLFNLDENTLSVFEPKKRAADGIYRIDFDKVQDKSKGYTASLRFLPNLSQDKKMGDLVVEKFVNWINIPTAPHLNGSFPSRKNVNEKCPVNDMFWKLRNAKMDDLAKQVSGSSQYYSYVLVIKDEQQPELEGKIMIYQYGRKIADKIKEEKMGVGETPCNVFDIMDGKNFVLVVKKVGGFNNYDSCKFVSRGPLKINKKAVDPKKKDDFIKFLLDRDCELNDYKMTEYSDDLKAKAKEIVAIMSLDAGFTSSDKKVAEKPADDGKIDEFFSDL